MLVSLILEKTPRAERRSVLKTHPKLSMLSGNRSDARRLPSQSGYPLLEKLGDPQGLLDIGTPIGDSSPDG
ncbi:hypothetical protein CA601_09040 [Paraburkholderia hospita]|nr:hypothetical protein CA602_43445 [Paraburkholderia hospita]OUL80824.1 hypothetical protein CA603_31330 [Paraburkholderia hospita]OUL94131.1 hypothetical protein CA601_09040 [Paraburkholderia hospita]